MKKMFAFLCSLALALSLLVTPAFAAEQSSVSNVSAVAASTSISPLATSQGLWYKENLAFFTVENAVVTPEKNSALNVWLKNTGTVTVTVYKTNFFGLWEKVYSTSFGSGERDVNVVPKCNGKKYMVKFAPPADGAVMSGLIYQH